MWPLAARCIVIVVSGRFRGHCWVCICFLFLPVGQCACVFHIQSGHTLDKIILNTEISMAHVFCDCHTISWYYSGYTGAGLPVALGTVSGEERPKRAVCVSLFFAALLPTDSSEHVSRTLLCSWICCFILTSNRPLSGLLRHWLLFWSLFRRLAS